jgi:hypothetical protein
MELTWTELYLIDGLLNGKKIDEIITPKQMSLVPALITKIQTMRMEQTFKGDIWQTIENNND